MFHLQDHADWERVAAGLSVAVGLVATIVAAAGRRWAWPNAVRRRVSKFAAARLRCGLLVTAASLAVNLAAADVAGVPRPVVQDEFGYLLAADTFAHGRLTNPTPACPDSFQSPHLLLRPTYTSKYPPGQGLTLAAGQVLTGLPIFGAWLTLAASAAAIYWAVLAFASPPWALLAGAVAAVHPQLVDWGHVYWGGGLAVLGGALVLGAWGRLMRQDTSGARPAAMRVGGGRVHERGSESLASSRGAAVGASRDDASDFTPSSAARSVRPRNSSLYPWLQSAVLGIGLVILANSRPYEGLAFALPLLAVLAIARGRRVLPPLLAVLLPAIAFTLYDDYRVTGQPLRPPIVEYARQFDVYAKLWFLPRRQPAPAYGNDVMRAVHTEFERGDSAALRTPAGLVRVSLGRAWTFATTTANPWVLVAPLAVAVAVRGDRRLRWVWAAVAAELVALWAENFFLPHYAAPATAAVLMLVVLGWRNLWRRWPAGAVGVGVGLAVGAAVADSTVGAGLVRTGRDDVVAASLAVGRHLVFVGYGPGHLLADEWVYNGADIAAQRVVWARDLGPAADADVAVHYPGRTAWRLVVGRDDLRMTPYAPCGPSD